MYPELNRDNLKELFKEQLDSWEQARENYKALESVLTKELVVDGFPFKVQFNPARIISSAAKVDEKSILQRKCFLCAENRPQVQKGLSYTNNSAPREEYTILINPFPIFPRHLTIPVTGHTDQLIVGRFGTMVSLAKELPGYTVFYNGPKCGASAPDHFHFQAGNRGFLPIEKMYDELERNMIFNSATTVFWMLKSGINGALAMESTSVKELEYLFDRICSQLEVKDGDKEPMLNLLCWYEEGRWIIHIFIRKKHRPSHYFAQGDDNILISPAAVDLGGTFITPLEKDFIKISEKEIGEILREVCISYEELEEISARLKSTL